MKIIKDISPVDFLTKLNRMKMLWERYGWYKDEIFNSHMNNIMKHLIIPSDRRLLNEINRTIMDGMSEAPQILFNSFIERMYKVLPH